jgi:abortive infection bacteriophage resistance protein
MPENPLRGFLNNKNLKINKLYPILSCMTYILQIISPNNNFNSNLKDLINSCGLINLKEMGFPNGWQNEPIWQ